MVYVVLGLWIGWYGLRKTYLNFTLTVIISYLQRKSPVVLYCLPDEIGWLT